MRKPKLSAAAVLAAAVLAQGTAAAQTNQALNDLLLEFEQGNNRNFPGAVYVNSNDQDANVVVAYGRDSEGQLHLVGTSATGGQGGLFGTGNGIDPLMSSNAVEVSDNHRFVLSVDAGSSTVSSFRINSDKSLTLVDRAFSFGIGPNSVAVNRGRVIVSNIDADGEFGALPDQEGSIMSYRLSGRGTLIPLIRNYRELDGRPAHVRFSPRGTSLIVSQFNAGSILLESGSNDQVLSYGFRGSRLSAAPVAAVTSTELNNAEGRNLPNTIGLNTFAFNSREFVIATEARAFNADGTPPTGLQTSSVSIWEIGRRGGLTPTALDLLLGSDFEVGQRAACWVQPSPNGDVHWVSNTGSSTISTVGFDGQNAEVLAEVAAEVSQEDAPGSAGFIDLDTDRDGRYLYQLEGGQGTVSAYEIGESGLTLIQETTSALPTLNTQGLAAF